MKTDGETRAPAALSMIAFTGLMSLFAAPVPALGQSAPDSDETDAVLATVQTFFDAIASKDAELGASTVMPDARMQGLRPRADGTLSGQSTTGTDFVQNLLTMPGQMLERMWDPEVEIRGSLATVWTPYDFHVDGEFSHCGIDAFTLIRTGAGWRIAGIVWTVEGQGCEPSPLGPPG